MSETNIETQKATVFVERKVSDNKYGSHVFGLHLPVELAPGFTAEDLTSAVLDAFEQAKTIVAKQSEPIVAALVEQSFAAPAPTGGRTAPRAANTSATVEYFCAKDAKVTSHFDNRADIASGKAKPKSPKLKCKVCREGVWDLDEALFANAADAQAPVVDKSNEPF